MGSECKSSAFSHTEDSSTYYQLPNIVCNMLLSPLVLLAGSSLVAAAVPAPAYCAKPPYKVILVLSSYAPAQSFCSARYPQAPATTVTVTVSTTVAGLAARVPVTPAPLVKDAVACAGNCAVWSSLSKVGGSILKSACSCIQTRPTATTTVSLPHFLPLVTVVRKHCATWLTKSAPTSRLRLPSRSRQRVCTHQRLSRIHHVPRSLPPGLAT